MASSLADLRRANPYPTDATDEQWAIIAPFLATASESGPGSKGGRPLDYDRREVWDAIVYHNRTGCQWRLLPHDFPPPATVFRYFCLWSKDGTIDAVHDALHEAVRAATPLPDTDGDDPDEQDRDPLDDGQDRDSGQGWGGGGSGEMRARLASAGVVDSQSIPAGATVGRVSPDQDGNGEPGQAASRNRPEGSADSRGYDAGKHVNGRKRHVLVDTLGLVIAVVVTAASVSDNVGGIAVLTAAIASGAGAHLRKVWVDAGYKKAFAEAAQKMGIQVEVVAKPPGQKGFPRRWVVERTHAWICACRRLARDYERRHTHAEAQFKIASIGVMLRRLAPTSGRAPWSPTVTAPAAA